MGFWTKHEKYNPETEKFEAVEREPLFGRRGPSEVKELTREEQVEPKRVHPWKTEGGKRFIAGTKNVGKKLDRAVVNYNRRSNPMVRRSGPSSYGSRGNANPFGSWFDSGQTSMRKPKSKSKTKYVIVGGKAYPKAGSGKTKKKKQSGKRKQRSNDPFSFDIGFGRGW